jgi:hypothetical protein
MPYAWWSSLLCELFAWRTSSLQPFSFLPLQPPPFNFLTRTLGVACVVFDYKFISRTFIHNRNV